MSLRLEMLQVARLAPNLLLESKGLVEAFILAQIHEDGGFKDRSGASDLYYTVFGMESLLALQSSFNYASIIPYLRSFEAGATLDFVHVTCLARAWADVRDGKPDKKTMQEILRNLEQYRTLDGGYNSKLKAHSGTAYACFLALGAYEDFEAPLPNREGILNCLQSLHTGDGGFTNAPNMPVGSTSPTAAAVTILRHLGENPDQKIGKWLLERCHPHGGFCATPQTPIPDLLSTATALHALAGMQVSFESIKQRCLDFIDSLWVNEGSFYGNWTEEALDSEYTYYGLLALGHLSL